MAEIAQADALRSAQKILDESDQIGNQVVQIATQMVQAVKRFTALKALASDEEDQQVFAARMAKSVATAKGQMGSLTTADREFLRGFVMAALAE